MNENKMNNQKSEQVNNKEQEPQISIELDSSVIQLPLTTFNNILDREITDFILNSKTDEKDIIDPKELLNIERWKSKYKELEIQAKVFESIVNRLERDLKKDRSAQPQRCIAASVSQYVKISWNNKLNMANAHGNLNKEHEIFTISDSEDEPIVTTVTSKTNGNDKVLPINTEFSTSLSNEKCLSTNIRKRKPGPKSKTMFVDDSVSSDTENKETVEKKIRLDCSQVINNKESSTTNLLDSTKVKNLEVAEKDNHNFRFKCSSSKYPPPYPLIPPHKTKPSWKNVPPIPSMTIRTSGNKVILTWNLNLTWQTAEIKMYELFVCQETDADPDISMWKKKGNIEADMLPMACELEVLDLGYIYHFALRAVDVHNRRAPFALQKIKV